jgi:hypothetical protein
LAAKLLLFFQITKHFIEKNHSFILFFVLSAHISPCVPGACVLTKSIFFLTNWQRKNAFLVAKSRFFLHERKKNTNFAGENGKTA